METKVKESVFPILLSALLTLAAHLSSAAETKPVRPCLVTWPQKITFTDGSLTMPAKMHIESAGDDPASAGVVAETFAADLEEMGFKPAVTGPAAGPKIILDLIKDKSLGDEGYRLNI